MGGNGSGRRWNSRQTTADYRQLDIRRWQREGLLVTGQRFVCDWWSVQVATSWAASRIAQSKPDHAILCHLQTRDRNLAPLTWTACNYGGVRAWFLCPTRGCGRRVAILYAGRTLACRICRRLAYPVEQESKWHRSLRRARAIRTKLQGSISLTDPLPSRPKGMHWRQYFQLCEEAQEHEGAVVGSLLAFLHHAESSLRKSFCR